MSICLTDSVLSISILGQPGVEQQRWMFAGISGSLPSKFPSDFLFQRRPEICYGVQSHFLACNEEQLMLENLVGYGTSSLRAFDHGSLVATVRTVRVYTYDTEFPRQRLTVRQRRTGLIF